MKKHKWIKILVISVVGLYIIAASAQEREVAARKNTSRTKKATPAKAKTVGELLKGYKDIQKSSTSLPHAQKVGPTTKPKNLSQVKPISSFDVFRADTEDEAELEKLLDDEIEQLYQLSNRYKKSPNRGELWLRLAELYVEKARLVSYRAQSQYDQDLASWEARGRKGGKPALKEGLAVNYNRKAIQLYEWFLNEFPNDRKIDQALFFLGYNYVELMQLKKGASYYEQLTKRFPNSPYVSESHFALGEYYFEKQDWKKAYTNYYRVVQNRSARLYGFALYKVAWCQYRLGRTSQAIETLERVVIHSRKQAQVSKTQGLKSVNRIRLASEALKDIVPFYAEAKKHEPAKAYFLSLAGEKALFPLLEKLAYAYSDLGKAEAARYVFKQLLDMRPKAPKAFDYQFQIVQNYTSRGSRETFRRELLSWITDYGPKSDWARANSGDKELLQKAEEQRETTLRNYTLTEHQTAQNSRSSTAQRSALEGYELYIKTFPAAERIDEMHFFYAELLYDLKLYERASNQYLWITENAQKSKYYETSFLNVLLSLEKKLPSDNELKAKMGDSTTPIPYSSEAEKFREAAERYLKTFPRGEKVPDIKFKIARLAYAHNQFDEALPRFQEMVKNYPRTQFAVYSANLILDIYNLRKDYEGLAQMGTQLMQQPELQRAGLNVDIKNVVERAHFKKAQDTESAKNYAESAKLYEEFAKKHPTSSLTLTARYNSAVNFERSGQILPAIAMYEYVKNSRAKGSSVDIRSKTLRLLARLYDQTGQYEKAAAELEVFARENPKDPFSSDAYYNAAILWEGLKNYTRALKNLEDYYKTSRKREKIETFLLMAAIQEKRGAFSAAIDRYDEYLKNNPRDPGQVILAHYKIATLSRRLNRNKLAKEWYQKTLAVQKRLSSTKGMGAPEAAESRFYLAIDSYSELIAIVIPRDPAKQGAIVKRKLDLLNRLNSEMGEVIKYDDGPMIVAALTTLGKAYEHMSRALFNAPVPSGFSAEEKKSYEAEISKIAAPLKDSAIQSFRQALDKSQQLQAYNDWVFEANNGLSRYDSSAVQLGERPIQLQEGDTAGL